MSRAGSTITPIAAAVGLGIALALVPAAAQEQGHPGRPVRTVLASAKLGSLSATPLHWRLLRVTVPGSQSVAYEGPAGMLAVLSGALTVSGTGDRRTLEEGEAVFIPASQRFTLAAGRTATVALHYLLVQPGELDRTLHTPAAAAAELSRTDRIPSLKSGPHELTMTRVTVQPKVPAPPMHHRSGAALYYVLAGTWRIHLDANRHEPRARGAIQFEPNGFWHTWENVGDTPGALLQANISPEGAPEIIFPPRQ